SNRTNPQRVGRVAPRAPLRKSPPAPPNPPTAATSREIGRASCRERAKFRGADGTLRERLRRDKLAQAGGTRSAQGAAQRSARAPTPMAARATELFDRR